MTEPIDDQCPYGALRGRDVKAGDTTAGIGTVEFYQRFGTIGVKTALRRRVRPPERLAFSRKKNRTGQGQRLMIDSSMIDKDLYCKTYGYLPFRIARKQGKENAQSVLMRCA